MGALDVARPWQRAAEVLRGFLISAGPALKVTVPSRADPVRLQAFVLEVIEEWTSSSRTKTSPLVKVI